MFNQLIPNVFSSDYWRNLMQEARLAWRLLRDRRVPLYIKAIPAAVLFYLVSPFDLVPGLIPIIGQLDDLAILLLGLRFFIRSSPPAVVAEHRREMGLGEG